MSNITHPLENDAEERVRFERITTTDVRATYRRVCERLTGGLPTWAFRKPAGRPRKDAKQ